jgi:hypothetical protein
MTTKLVYSLSTYSIWKGKPICDTGPPGQILLLSMPIIFAMRADLVLVLNNYF